ncbi:hypothetical protein [Streptomyces boncukensis]|uniref:Uncharacterized protein n=1 Tax=Streptomyces boncukensis TaxID=2711219 RepID=A0A6G4WNP2_9ACTN|nr:hypothetical protein [Streptomyces boncukensis]NGO66815.1 hypothetical protein [Streptomyces boncukensis]
MSRRVPGNPMASILRDIDRRTRATTRRARPARPEAEEQPAAPAQAAQAAPKPTPPGVAAFALVTGEDGGARVEFARPFAAPVVVASVIGAGTGVAVVEEVTYRHAVVRVVSSSGTRTPRVPVHVIVTEATG